MKNQTIKPPFKTNEKLENKEVKNTPTPHCQSIMIPSLSVRAEKMMEKNSDRFSRAPLHGMPSPLMD
jgi:hypothetical protein